MLAAVRCYVSRVEGRRERTFWSDRVNQYADNDKKNAQDDSHNSPPTRFWGTQSPNSPFNNPNNSCEADFAKLGPHNLAREEAGASEYFLSLWFQLTLAYGRELPLFLVICPNFGTQPLRPGKAKPRPDLAPLSFWLEPAGPGSPT